MPVTETTRQDLYRQGVNCLVEGRFDEAVERLQPAASQGDPNARLALGRAYLELGRGTEAAAQLDALLCASPESSGMRAYLHLLAASAAAFTGRVDDAERHLDLAQSGDARLEHAVRNLRRRLRKGSPPLVRL